MPNRLADETSPYLLQHARNPVDWEPWDQRALDRAHAEDKPIFLSIGYSACHWCHVMEHESFENPEIAALMNEHFVCIKVDREERPDLDHIYMTAVQAMTGRGGWPMSVFLTPELQPFYGGTYFPPTARMQMPGFVQVLRAVEDAWRNRRQTLVEQSRELTRHIAALGDKAGSHAPLEPNALRGAELTLERVFDFQHGGFGAAPKFPHPMDLRLLLRRWRRTGRDEPLRLVEITLDRMAAGGIYDQLAGGFHRYSVDERWLVPHFEKMLYDNGLLAQVYLEAWQATQRDTYRDVVEQTLDWTLVEMQTPTGGFASALDADSDGVEGKFYVWTPDEVDAVLGAERARTFCYVYDVSPEGNFEEQSILNLPISIAQCARILSRDEDELRAELATDRRLLLARRGERIRPGLDDKVLVGWNALMIDALAQAGAALQIDRYVMAAQRSARFILDEMRGENGRLWRAWREGRARFAAYLDDYAGLANALVSLYESDFDERWIDDAIALVEIVLARFPDSIAGGFFYTADDHERLISRHKDWQDASIPSGNGLAATALVRLARLTGRRDLADAAEATLAAFAGPMRDAPMACGQLLLALDEHLGPSAELAIVAQGAASADLSKVLADVRRRYWPATSLAVRPATHQTPTLDALFVDKLSADSGEPAMHVCQSFACQAPAVGRAAISDVLEANAPFAQFLARP